MCVATEELIVRAVQPALIALPYQALDCGVHQTPRGGAAALCVGFALGPSFAETFAAISGAREQRRSFCVGPAVKSPFICNITHRTLKTPPGDKVGGDAELGVPVGRVAAVVRRVAAAPRTAEVAIDGCRCPRKATSGADWGRFGRAPTCRPLSSARRRHAVAPPEAANTRPIPRAHTSPSDRGSPLHLNQAEQNTSKINLSTGL